jgi:hypothetical protein
LDAFHASFAWGPSRHLSGANFILDCNLLRDFIDVFEVFELVDESLSGGDVHDGVVAVLPLHVDVELLDAFLVGKFEHFFMDEFSAGIELPVPILVAHSISHR